MEILSKETALLVALPDRKECVTIGMSNNATTSETRRVTIIDTPMFFPRSST